MGMVACGSGPFEAVGIELDVQVGVDDCVGVQV